MQPILRELKNLEDGICFKIGFEVIKVLRFFLITGVFDKPARASFLNIISSNGYFGCLKCLQPGETINHVHVYKFKRNNPSGPLRNKETYDSDCQTSSNGIKGKIGLSDLRYFSPLYSTNIDYMHSVLEGVVKRFFKYWFDVPWSHSLKSFTLEIDKRLMRIKPPSFVPITPRSIEQRNKWRANEYLDFLLYYCLPVFHGIMEPTYWTNLMKLVVSMEVLLDRKIKRNDLLVVRKILISFVKEAEEIYPPEIMVSGMHELLHLVDCTIEFGPLNCVNSFQFEELNRKILSLIHGKDLMGDEFMNLFSILQALVFFSFKNTNKVLIEYFEKHNIIKSSNTKRLTTRNENLKPLGKTTIPSVREKNFILSYYDETNIDSFKLCYKFSFKGILYTSLSSDTKRCDYCIKTRDNNFYGLIEYFLYNESKVYVVCKKLVKLLAPFFDPENSEVKSKSILCNLTERQFVTTIDKLVKVFFIKVSDNNNNAYISSFSISHLFM